MTWSTWSPKGDKRDDVDALSYTLASGKGSSCTRLSFHCFKESEKSLNETPVWSIDCGGIGRCPLSGQWTEVQRSSTQYGQSKRLSNIPIHVCNRSRQRPMRWYGRGMQTEVALG